MKKILVLALASLTLLPGCSTQNREAETLLSDIQLNELVTDMAGDANTILASLFSADGQSTGSNVRLYHAGSMKGRPASSVLALVDIGIFDPAAGWAPYTWSKDTTLDDAQVLFIENDLGGGDRSYTLAVRMHFSNEQDNVYFEATSTDYNFSGDVFEATLDSSNHTIVVRSEDISDDYGDVLADSVKLYVYVLEPGVGERYVGQISTMAAYN